MRSSLLALSSLIFLTACPEEIVMGPPATTEPAPAPVKLRSGEYSVLITGITALDCDGVRGQDLAGLKLPLSLQVHAHQAVASFAGFELEGERHGGVLSLTGSLGDEPVVQSEEDEQSEDESSGGSTASEESEASEGAEGSDESEDIDSEDSESGDADVAQMEELVSLELVEQSTTHAEGRMFFSAGACSFEVPVSAQRISGSGGGEEKPVPVEEGEETESGCDDGEEDCG